MGRATNISAYQADKGKISIHALRGEGDVNGIQGAQAYQIFQSTPSVGRATRCEQINAEGVGYFNPRPPWGGRPYRNARTQADYYISIHALRGEGDKLQYNGSDVGLKFQSTPSVGRATNHGSCGQREQDISIHALRGEGDDSFSNVELQLCISIHALRGEGDSAHDARTRDWHNFNPRPPWGGRLTLTTFTESMSTFQSTPSVGRATSTESKARRRIKYFNPRPPWGGRR